ncbi:hypothetical protein PC9H_000284 [Pleurotus ostreatus]|uniref:Uncharacterized protein n=1 Tax=Pleurotus ostreatus TaxID=5322 RepID=A0A8H7A3G0_PLEOS|nr:uncharacterized protein PC9H_000284 [Pleurotus ostreatus]KAF7439947.1 hypothetical protein PC9H_000284 [Pleurotus ostreatus]KAJ8700847.1 hypothetical protein PTI98_003834 [Pleurotus ostreatus]
MILRERFNANSDAHSRGQVPRSVDISYSGWAPDLALAIYDSKSASKFTIFPARSWDILEYAPDFAAPLLTASDYSHTPSIKTVPVFPFSVHCLDSFFIIHNYYRTLEKGLVSAFVFDQGRLTASQSKDIFHSLILTAAALGVRSDGHAFWKICRDCHSQLCTKSSA